MGKATERKYTSRHPSETLWRKHGRPGWRSKMFFKSNLLLVFDLLSGRLKCGLLKYLGSTRRESAKIVLHAEVREEWGKRGEKQGAAVPNSGGEKGKKVHVRFYGTG